MIRRTRGLQLQLRCPQYNSNRTPERKVDKACGIGYKPNLQVRTSNLDLASNTITSDGGGGGYQPAPRPSHPSPHSQHRKRNASVAGLDSPIGSDDSPENEGTEDGQQNDGKRHPVKRACNECRQQKLRCDVKQDPFKACSRCHRLQLSCKIDDTFKRVGKRSRNAEMEREIAELRRQVAQFKARPNVTNYDQWTDPAVAGLLDLRSGVDGNGVGKTANGSATRRLEGVVLPSSTIEELFRLFFSFYHPFCPFLNPDRFPEDYFSRSPLLFWTIAAIGARHYGKDKIYADLSGPVTRLCWHTLQEVPQNYHVVKALILLCTWPFSTSSTSTDPTFMLCGNMMQIALQIGLHRPSHAQDFTKFTVDLRDAELQDRIRTWATCNIVAQRVATAYGQPANTLYDWSLSEEAAISNTAYLLPPVILNGLKIEKFVDKVSRALYTNPHDAVGLGADHERSTYVSFLMKDYQELQTQLRDDTSPITILYLGAAHLHLRLCVFFSPPTLPSYQGDLLELYHATIKFLDLCLSLDSQAGVTMPSSWNTGLQIIYAPNFIFQMMLAAGFSLLKLNYTFLKEHNLDTEGAAIVFRRTVDALRRMSVIENDLAERLAEVLAQVWRSGRGKSDPNSNYIGEGVEDESSLQLRIRCRMSMSHVFDAVWRWRRNFQFKGKSLESYLKNPTDPAATNDSSASSTVGGTQSRDNGPVTTDIPPGTGNDIPGMAGMPTGMGIEDFRMGFANSNASYEVFDPLNWMLDGLVDFPYNYEAIQGLQQQGLAPNP